MTETSPNISETRPGDHAVACSACAHSWVEHDQIATRFCAATVVGHHNRGCVCSVVPSTGKTH